MKRATSVVIAALVLGVGLGIAAADTTKPVVMVIYFDNLTGKAEHEVMKKGLADMIITDLVAYDSVTVVERDKLEAVLGELKLQSTAAFDPATRAKVGKQVGARYLISGSMLGVVPQVRIDARLTDITTGVEVVAASVRGAPEQLFDLEQELVQKLTAGIDAKLTNNTSARKLKGVDVAAVLAYSKGLDLEDRGKLEEARKQYSEALKRKPTFSLPRERTAKLIAKLAELQSNRSAALSTDAVTLAKAIEQALAASLEQLPEAKQHEYLKLRQIRGRILARQLRDHLHTKPHPNVVIRGHEAAALGLMRGIHGNYELLRQEVARVRRQRPTGWLTAKIPEDLERIVREADLDDNWSIREGDLLREHGEFVLCGRVEDGRKPFSIGPALGDLDPKLSQAMLATLDREVAALLKNKTADHVDTEVERTLDLAADALIRVGKTEEGIAKLQRFLDEFPTSTRYADVTRRINIELGIERHGSHNDFLDYPDKGLKQCDFGALAHGVSANITRRVSVKGPAVIAEIAKEVDRACGNFTKHHIYWPTIYSTLALSAAGYGECEIANKVWQMYLAKGGSRSDLAGYQKWHPECKFPITKADMDEHEKE